MNMQTTPAKMRAISVRRHPCPIACALDIFGDRWTLLIVRDLVLGRSRFKEFSTSPEGIPTNILADRLQRLLEKGIVRLVPSPDGTKHMAYALTPKGNELLPVLKAMKSWALKWEPRTRAILPKID